MYKIISLISTTPSQASYNVYTLAVLDVLHHRHIYTEAIHYTSRTVGSGSENIGGCMHVSPTLYFCSACYFTADTLRTAIEQRRAKGMELLAKKDIDGVVSFFTPDATVMFPGSDNISGVDGIEIVTLYVYRLAIRNQHRSK